MSGHMRIPVAKEGWPFIVPAFAAAAAAYYFAPMWAFAVLLMLAVFIVNFFRDPERAVPDDPDAVICPADGRVIKVEKVMDDRFTGKKALVVCVFMNVFNVHVNRAPVRGRIKEIRYNKGRFFPADKEKASLENEQNAVFIESEKGLVVANQIAGLVARRIVCRKKVGDELEKGERFGLIRFGSRVDVFMPAAAVASVKVGDKVKAGSSVLGRL